MAVSFSLDTTDLANAYEKISNSQFADGQLLLEKLQVESGNSVLDIGNYLNHVPVSLRELAKADIAFELEKYRVNGVIRYDGYKLTAIAQKPER